MFPAVKLPTFEETTAPSILDQGDLTKSINNMGYFYSIGLFNQMLELHKLSSTIFLELEKDFNQLNNRLNIMQSRLADFKQKANQVIQRNANLSPDQMAQKPCVQNPMPNISSGQDADLSNADIYVQDLLRAANPPPTLQPWASVIPNYAELDKKITNPEQFAIQYREELLKDLEKEIKKQERKKKKTVVSIDENKTAEKSSTMLHAYTETVTPPTITLLTPPPKGQTSDWRNKAYQQMQQAQSSTASAAKMTAPPPRMAAPTIRPAATLSAPISAPQQAPAQTYVPSAPSAAGVPAPPPPPTGVPAPPPPPAGLPPPPATTPHAPAPPPQSTPKPPAPPPQPAQPSHLDLIKSGGFKLKKVIPAQPAPKPTLNDVDPNSLSVGELLSRVAEIRNNVQDSDDDDEEDEESSSSSNW